MDLFLLRELDLLQAKGLFEAKYKKVRKKLEEQPVRDYSYHKKLYKLLKINIAFVRKYDMTNYGKALFDMMSQLNLATKHERLRNILATKNYITSSNNKTQIKRLRDLYKPPEIWLTAREIHHDPIFYICSQLVLLLNGKGSLDEFEKNFRENIHLFRSDFQAEIYVLFTNCHLRRGFQDEGMAFYKRRIKMIEWGLEDRFLFEGEILHEVVYRSLITMCYYTQQLELGEYYLQNLKNHLIVELREEVYTYCKGMLRMAQGGHKEAMKYLNRKFTHPPLDFRARKIVLMLKYDHGERVSLENEIRALTSWIERSTYLNLEIKIEAKLELQFLDTLIRSFKNSELQKLKERLRELKGLAYRNWLFEKIDEKLNCVHTPLLD
ncbi:MAG: hypothetical protein AAFP89_20955 [Bacteroidota bacterium]